MCESNEYAVEEKGVRQATRVEEEEKEWKIPGPRHADVDYSSDPEYEDDAGYDDQSIWKYLSAERHGCLRANGLRVHYWRVYVDCVSAYQRRDVKRDVRYRSPFDDRPAKNRTAQINAMHTSIARLA